MIPPLSYIPQPNVSLLDNHAVQSLDDRVQQSAQMMSASVDEHAAGSFWPDFDSDPTAAAFLNALWQIPSSGDNPQLYADEVSQLMRNFVDPETGELAFTTLEQQTEILQRTLENVGTNADLRTALSTTLCGTANLQFQMTKWMQDIVLSNGEIKEFEEW
ncbi:hypothetical protein [Obesumbacterium proteus]|uniref:hypothetical protein n=1 Tax=Obesumbacterium proteus TaxID=82983 RepID=UPI002431C89F|nr:hypothetical protein [Obesumbacterium proteus]